MTVSHHLKVMYAAGLL
nr:ArsR family transcriptional regulator [Chamaesiphon sp. GL140_3_metabinner_50]